MAYLVHSLLENTSSQPFLRMEFAKKADTERILAPPQPPDVTESLTPSAAAAPSQDEPSPALEAPFRNKPVYQFTDEADHQAFQSAIDRVRGRLGGDYPVVIAGEKHTTAHWTDLINPARPREVVGRAGSATDRHANLAVDAETAEFRVGNLYLNRKITGAMVSRQPFGGRKMSGISSKASGPDYLLQFLEPRSVTENTIRRGFAPQAERREAGVKAPGPGV